jgi:glutathione S-transferase
MSEEHKSDDMRLRNPLMRVPILELSDGTCISEAMAICRYFEALQPQPALFGETAKEQALTEMWQRRVELNLMHPIAHAFRHSNPKMAHLESPQIPEWGKANVPRIEMMLDLLESELSSREFVAGDKFSVADIDALCAVDFMRVARVSLKDSQTNLMRWHQAVAARPSASA